MLQAVKSFLVSERGDGMTSLLIGIILAALVGAGVYVLFLKPAASSMGNAGASAGNQASGSLNQLQSISP